MGSHVHIFGILGDQKILASRDLKMGIVTMKKLLPFYIQVNKWVTSF